MKEKLIKKGGMGKKGVWLVLSILVCMFIVAGCDKADNAQTAKSSEESMPNSTKAAETSEQAKEINVVGAANFFPVIYTDENGNLTGFEHDVIEEIAKRSDLKVKWETIGDISAMFGGIDSGKYDTIASQISVTDERKKTYNFSEVYAYNEIKMAVRGDDTAQSLDDLQGRKVCIEFGTVLEDFFNEYNKDLPEDKKIKLVVTEGNIYEELEVGHYDAFPITVLSFDQVKEKGNYNLKLIGEPIIIDKQAFPFSKEEDAEVVEKFNKAIKDMHEDGTLSKLSKQYYNIDVTSSSLK